MKVAIPNPSECKLLQISLKLCQADWLEPRHMVIKQTNSMLGGATLNWYSLEASYAPPVENLHHYLWSKSYFT